MKQLLLTILFITFVLPLTAQSAGEMVNPSSKIRSARCLGHRRLWFGLAPYPCHQSRRHPKTKGRTSRDT